MALRSETIWFDQHRYESVETAYHTVLADRYLGLKIEGKSIIPNPISNEIEKAMALIGKSLKSKTPANANTADLEKRIIQLEKENMLLQSTTKDILIRLAALEGSFSDTHDDRIASNVDGAGDDDFDLFGPDEDGMNQVQKERIQSYAEKKSKKPQVVAKSNLILDVKPWDDETDLLKIEASVRSVTADGLLWGASKILPVAFGIKKLQISCVVEDDKIGTDFLEESITAFEDLVQSVDVVAFNKI